MLDKTDYFSDSSDERLFVDELENPTRNDSQMTITIETKNSYAKKMRLRVWGYANGEYIYLLHDGSLTLKYKTYTIKSQFEELEA